MKKVELHLHLDGSLNLDYASKLAGRDVSCEMISKDDTSLTEYLKKFSLPGELFQDYDNIVEFSYLLGKELEKDDVIYAEIRFCPLFHINKISVDRVITGIRVGLSKVSSVKTNLIFCMMRHFSYEENMKIVKLAQKYYGNGCCGLDLAGDEANFKTSSFDKLFEEVRKTGIPFTIHAGESDDYTSVVSAVNFGAKRIGHGIHSIEDKNTIKLLVEKGIVLEVCPDSNVDTHAVKNILEHPIKKLDDAGVLVTISTDNRTVSDTSLENEYKLVKDNLHISDEDLVRYNLNAIDAAFISDSEKDELKKILLN